MIEVNGDQVAHEGTLIELATAMELPERGVAVAVNGEVVRRLDWAATMLSDGDRVEVLTATQGG